MLIDGKVDYEKSRGHKYLEMAKLAEKKGYIIYGNLLREISTWFLDFAVKNIEEFKEGY